MELKGWRPWELNLLKGAVVVFVPQIAILFIFLTISICICMACIIRLCMRRRRFEQNLINQVHAVENQRNT